MRHLIIGDIHEKPSIAQSIINKHTDDVDKIILVGDYFDNWNSECTEFINTAQWLIKLCQDNPKVIPLVGNHDLSYITPMWAKCSGWSMIKQHAFYAYKDNIVRLLQPYYLEGNLLVTHAGLAKDISLGVQAEAIEQAFLQPERYQPDLEAHTRDGGSENPAGIIWNRPHYNILSDDYVQIFGHTRHSKPTWYQDQHLCIDTDLWHYVLVNVIQDDVNIEIHEV